jgi:hypothetical protein
MILKVGAAAISATLMMAVFASTAIAQMEERPDPGAEKPPWIAADLPPSDYVKGEAPAPVEKVYRKKPSKVWKKLVQLLEREGLTASTLDEASGAIQTELKIFDEVKGPFRNVATKPQVASRNYPIRQFVSLSRGRYSLQIQVTPDDRTRVSIHAYIEERAFHIGESVKLWAERHSNGTIEKYFFDKLDQEVD